MPSLSVRSVVVDFDGTICEQDVSEELLQAFAPPGWQDIDVEFQQGRIGSRECLVRQGAMLDGSRSSMLAFALRSFAIDPSFPPFARWAAERGIDVSVASDGFGFYVQPMLRAGGVEGVAVLTNETTLTPSAPPGFAFPHAHPECVGCGTCKMSVVQARRRRLGGRVAFVGEGHSDRYGALYADVVFAKKQLIDICRADGVPFHAWETFDDVRRALESMDGLEERTGPARCPGWTPAGS